MERLVMAVAGSCVLLAVCAAGGRAQAGARVVRTIGDPSEATCVEVEGESLWIGTLGAGVFRTQGERPERFDAVRGLAGNRVRDCVMFQGVLWVATDEALSRFEPRAGRFHTVARGRYLRVAAAGALLLGARGDGVVERFVNGVREGASAALSVPAALVAAADGRWALGGVDGALYLGLHERVRRVAIAERGAVPVEPIERLAIDGHALLATTASRELRVERWDARDVVRPAARSVARGDSASALQDGVLVHDAARFAGGEVFATDAGVFVRSAGEAGARPIAFDGQPCGDRIAALAVQGALLWVGSFDRGLCRFDGRAWAHFRAPRDLPSDMVNALAVAGDALYVATAQGLAVVDAAGAFTHFTHEQCAARLRGPCPWHAAINGVAFDAATSQVWVADVGAAHRIDARTGQWHRDGARAAIRSRSLTRVAAFGGEAAIATSDRGLYLLRGGKARALSDQDGLADDWVTDVAYDARGRLLVATCTRGVSVQDEHGALRTLTTRDGLAHDYALSVQEIDGRVWIGTVAGVSILDGGQVTTLTAHDGLSGNEIHDAVAYAGAVWLATDGGLSVVELGASVPAASAAPLYSREAQGARVLR